MTLILTVNGPETIWLLADRRLSYKRKEPKDDARKVMCLETTDGIAILGYAGLGATGRGTEPADWMSAVLRGRNLPLEQSLGVLAEALRREFPRHMAFMPGQPAHAVMVPAFVGEEVRLYEIDLVLAPDRKQYFRYTRHVVSPQSAVPRTPRLALAGSGAPYLAKNQTWIRGLLRIVKACDRRQVTPLAVADHLAKINYQVHLADKEKLVGPRCIVVWRHRKAGVYGGGGAHKFFNGCAHDLSESFPTISHGTDMAAFFTAIGPFLSRSLAALRTGEQAPDENKDEINAALSRLPDKPDEKLR